jgi:glycerol-3-phosphate dehydrogenase
LTKPLPTTIPIFKWLSGIFNSPLKFVGLLDKPAERGAVIIKLGLMMYDFYVRGDSEMPGHRFDNRSNALQSWPGINRDLIYAATYYDGAMTSPERLALEILMDGVNEGDHARAVNYLSAVGAEGDKVILKDQISGEEIAVQPRVVINAGGPWIDFINQGISARSDFIGGTKGSHLIVDHPELRNAIGDHEIFFEYVDGRIVLIFPYLEGLVMIGSTDLRIDDPDQALCTDDEVDYILGMVPQIFPDIDVNREHIVFQFSGVRPLPVAKGSTGQISRDHSIELLEDEKLPWPILSLVGGKWTSYRAFSEQTTDAVLGRLGIERVANTTRLKIGGSADYPEKGMSEAWVKSFAEKTVLNMDRAQDLFERYGTRAPQFGTGDQTPLVHLESYTVGEIKTLVEEEMATHLDDLLLRRTKTAWVGALTRESIEEIAGIMAGSLGWSKAEKLGEVDRALNILRDIHAVKI